VAASSRPLQLRAWRGVRLSGIEWRWKLLVVLQRSYVAGRLTVKDGGILWEPKPLASLCGVLEVVVVWERLERLVLEESLGGCDVRIMAGSGGATVLRLWKWKALAASLEAHGLVHHVRPSWPGVHQFMCPGRTPTWLSEWS
jgi:hypothetical protein